MVMNLGKKLAVVVGALALTGCFDSGKITSVHILKANVACAKQGGVDYVTKTSVTCISGKWYGMNEIEEYLQEVFDEQG